MKNALACFSQQDLQRMAGQRVVLLISGGPDSLALLSLFSTLKKMQRLNGAALSVLHVNYGLRGTESEADANFVLQMCRRFALPCRIVRAPAKSPRENLQSFARRFRYQEASRFLENPGIIVTAHHLEDQWETLLMRKSRGAGLRGLCGMRRWSERRYLGRTDFIFRPFLAIQKNVLEEYLVSEKMIARHDSSNQKPIYWRNRIRQNILIKDNINLIKYSNELLQTIDIYFSRREKFFSNLYPHGIYKDRLQSWPKELQFRYFAERLRAKGWRGQFSEKNFLGILSRQQLEFGSVRWFVDKNHWIVSNQRDEEIRKQGICCSGVGVFWSAIFAARFSFPVSQGPLILKTQVLAKPVFDSTGRKIRLKEVLRALGVPVGLRRFWPVVFRKHFLLGEVYTPQITFWFRAGRQPRV